MEHLQTKNPKLMNQLRAVSLIVSLSTSNFFYFFLLPTTLATLFCVSKAIGVAMKSDE